MMDWPRRRFSRPEPRRLSQSGLNWRDLPSCTREDLRRYRRAEMPRNYRPASQPWFKG